jgi:hypothetical protein
MDQKILQPMVLQPASQRQLRKPILIITVTDGAPAGEQRLHIASVISNAVNQLRNSPYGPDALSFQFAQVCVTTYSLGVVRVCRADFTDASYSWVIQVGNDIGARDFLQELDANPQIGSLIDCTSNYELEADQARQQNGIDLSPELWLVKLLLGPIDSSKSDTYLSTEAPSDFFWYFSQAMIARMNEDTKHAHALAEGGTLWAF